MDTRTSLFTYEGFIPELEIDSITKKHTLAKITIRHVNAPGHICGVAKRVGFTGKLDSDLAIYRLKILQEGNHSLITIPALFVVTGGKFVEYEHWKELLSAY